MGVTIKEKVTAEGKQFAAFLEDIEKLEAVAGFQSGKATAKKRKSDGTIEDTSADLCEVAAYNEFGTERIPPRPFMRRAIDDHKTEIKAFVEEAFATTMTSANSRQLYNMIGTTLKGFIQWEIKTGNFVPNARSTILKKLSSKPLIDTGHMRQSVMYEVRKKGKDE